MSKKEKQQPAVLYSHFRVGNGAATCAGILDEEDGSYRFVVSLCSPSDNFKKSDGRVKAIQKLFAPKENHLTAGAIRMTDNVRNSEMGRRAVIAVLNSLQVTKKSRWYTGLNEEAVEIRSLWLDRTRDERSLKK